MGRLCTKRHAIQQSLPPACNTHLSKSWSVPEELSLTSRCSPGHARSGRPRSSAASGWAVWRVAAAAPAPWVQHEGAADLGFLMKAHTRHPARLVRREEGRRLRSSPRAEPQPAGEVARADGLAAAAVVVVVAAVAATFGEQYAVCRVVLVASWTRPSRGLSAHWNSVVRARCSTHARVASGLG